MSLGHEVPDRIKQVLDQWAPFPVDEEPRPLVLLASRVRALGFPDGETKRAFIDRAFEAQPGFPSHVFEAMVSSDRDISGTILLLSSATLEDFEFATDRGRRLLPAWRVRAEGIREPIWVLDPAIEDSIWEPMDSSIAGLAEAWHGGTATTGRDGCTITMSFIGSPAEQADYPDARVFQEGGAVAILPIGLSRLRPEQPRHMIGARREVTVVLSQPLGARVLLDNTACQS
jgi:hypothetical protein